MTLVHPSAVIALHRRIAAALELRGIDGVALDPFVAVVGASHREAAYARESAAAGLTRTIGITL